MTFSRLPYSVLSHLARRLSLTCQVPKRAYSLQELRLNKIQPEQFLAPKDTTLSSVRNIVQVRWNGKRSLLCTQHTALLLGRHVVPLACRFVAGGHVPTSGPAPG